MAPVVFAGASAACASVVLGTITLVSGRPFIINRATLIYAAVAGQITFAIPFGMLVVVIPHIGSGIPSILQSMTPIITLGIVYALHLEKPNPVRMTGLAAGLAGALIILVSRNAGAVDASASFLLYLAALVTPAVLATGNVYRTTSWPEGQGPLPLATLTLAAAAIGIFLFLGLGWLMGNSVEIIRPLTIGWWLIIMQAMATGVGYAFFFRLQQVGGPVYLSQISYVNTAVGVGFAVLIFSERLSVWVWVAVALVFAGIALVNRTNAAPAARSSHGSQRASY